MKKPHRIAAAVKAAAKGSSFVLASTDQSLASDANAFQAAVEATALQEYVCSGCGTEIRTTASTEPFCITCGSESVTAKSAVKVKSGLKDDSSLVAVTCGHCQHTSFIDEASAKTITASSSGKIHCVACGSHVRIESSDFLYDANDSSDADDLDTLDSIEAFPTMDGDDIDAEGDIDMVGSEDLDDDFSVQEMEQDLQDQTASDDLLVPESPYFPGGPVADSLEFVPDVAEPTPDLTVFDDMAEPSAVVDDFDLPDTGEPLIDTFGLDDSGALLDFVASAGRVVAMKGPISVGVITAKTAGNKADLLGTPAFVQACRKVVAKRGVRAGLQGLGFKLIRSAAISQATVTSKVTAAQVKADSKVAEHRKVMTECMALAAAGLNRGQWKGHTNALRASVERELQRAGVRGARAVAASIFADAGIEHAKTLVTVATLLAGMSPAQRQETAALLDLVEPAPTAVPSAVDDPDFDEDFDLDVAARMTTAGARGVQVTASTTTSVSQILNSNSPLTFSSF